MRTASLRFRNSLALGALLLVAAGWTLDRSDFAPVAFFGGNDPALRYEKLRRTSGSIDVLAVGPSFMAMGFDAERFTQETGLSAFNFGVDGSDLYYQSRLLRDVLLPLHHPKVVLWGMRDVTRSKRRINDQFLASPSLQFPAGSWRTRAFQLCERLPHYRRRRLADWFDALFALPTRWIDARGQAKVSGTLPSLPPGAADDEETEEDDEEGGGGAPGQLQEYPVSLEEARAHFVETLRLLAAARVEVWILFTPYHERIFRRGSRFLSIGLTGGAEDYTSWVARTAESAGLPLLNLRSCAEISPHGELFFDARHLNEVGAARFTELLAELYTHERAWPPEWSGLPSPAEEEAFFGRAGRDSAPRLQPGARLALRSTDAGGLPVRDVYADLVIETPDRYRLVLADDQQRVHTDTYFIRVTGKRFLRWNPPKSAHARVEAGQFTLPAGVHRLEIHTRSGPIDWDALRIERIAPR